MRLSFIAAAALLLQQTSAESRVSDNVQIPQVYYQSIRPFSSQKPNLLASVEYEISTLESTVQSYSPPPTSNTTSAPETSHPLLRISTDSPGGSTTITSLSTFNPAYTQTLTIHLNDDGFVFAASFSADPLTPPPNASKPADKLKVVLLKPTPGPAPKLNSRKPVVVNADGKEVPEVPEVEKSFFQKYWWAFALVAVLALTGGGDK